MPSKPAGDLLQDILNSAVAIRTFVAGMNFDEYVTDLKTQSAVERQFLIIAEAAKRLGDAAVQLCPEQDWRALRSFGNIIRHDYESVSHLEVWQSLEEKLPKLESDVQRALRQLQESD